MSYCHARTSEKYRDLGVFRSLRRYTMTKIKKYYPKVEETGFITHSKEIWENLIKSGKRPGKIIGYTVIKFFS